MGSPVLLFKARRVSCSSGRRVSRSSGSSAIGAESGSLPDHSGIPPSVQKTRCSNSPGIHPRRRSTVFVAPGELLAVPRELPKELKSGPAGPNTSRIAPVAIVLSRSQLERSPVAAGALEDEGASEAGHGLLVSFLLRIIQMRGILV